MDGNGTRDGIDERLLTLPPASAAPLAPAPVSLPAIAADAGAGRPVRRSVAVRAAPWRERLAETIEEEKERGAGFLLIPVLIGAGALAYAAMPYEPSGAAIAIAGAVLSLLALLARHRGSWLAIVMAPLLLVAGLGLGKIEMLRRATPMLGSAVATTVIGRIAGIEKQATGRWRLTIDVLATREPTLRFPPSRIRVTAAKLGVGLGPGQGINGRVRLAPPSGPVRPGGYDFAWRAYFDGVGAIGFFLGAPQAVVVDEPGNAARAAGAIETLRAGMAERIRARVGGAEGEIAAALIVGAAAGIPDDLADAMRLSGLFHVLSISGLHMALVAGLVMGGLRLAFAAFPAFAERHAVKKFAAGAAWAGATFYLFLSGAGVATQRSYLMIAVMLAAVLADRAALTMRNLAIAALVILVLAPHEVAGPSFQMSFAATAALVAGWTAFSRWRIGRPERRRNRGIVRAVLAWGVAAVAGVAATSLLAGGATTLIAAWHFHRIAPLGLVANLAAMPVVSGIIMPSATAAVVLMPAGLDGPALDLMGRGIAAMNAIAAWTAARSPVDGVGLVPGVAIAVYTGGLLIAATASTRLFLLALPLLGMGMALAFTGAPPDAFVSEDGRLVGVVDGQRMLVDRTRPNAFALDEWLAAANVAKVTKPAANSEAFRCDEGLCILDRPGRPVVAHAADADTARPFCARAALLVIDDPAAENPCAPGEATVISRRTLARRGSAAIRFVEGSRTHRAVVDFAVADPFRPWHAQRAFSRAARGLPERDARSP